jgi:hypothetical protein
MAVGTFPQWMTFEPIHATLNQITPIRTMQKIVSYTIALATATAMGLYVYAGAVAGYTMLNSNTPTHTQN